MVLGPRDALVYSAISSVIETIIVNKFAPQFALAHGFAKATFGYFAVNFTLYLIFRIGVWPNYIGPFRNLPYPPGSNPITGNGIFEPAIKPCDNILQWIKQTPNDRGLVKFRQFFNGETLVPTSFEALKYVLSDKAYDYHKPPAIRDLLVRFVGPGLIFAEGDHHKFQRKHMMPAFQVQQIRNLYPVFWDKARMLVQGLEAEIAENGVGSSLEFTEWATRVTMDIIGVAAFGKELHALKNPDDELVSTYSSILEPTKEMGLYFVFNIMFGSRFVRLLPWRMNNRMDQVTKTLRGYCLDLVRERQASVAAKRDLDGRDILTLLVKSNDFKDVELVDQCLTFLGAGHETTSSALSWLCYLMARHPEAQARAREEIRNNLPPLDTAPGPTSAQVEDLPYLNAICNETFRLYPTVPGTSRAALRHTEIPVRTDGGTVMQKVPAGSIVVLVPWAIHRLPQIWGEDAETFRPERWLGEGNANTGGQTNNYSILTFLHGPRSCIGQGFAKAELKCLVAAILGRFEIELAKPDEEVIPGGMVTIKPVGGLHLKMKPLEGW